MATVDYEQRGHVVTITLNRPDAMNAMNQELVEEMSAAFGRFRDDNDAWVASVTGAGEKAFSAGADLKLMSSRSPEDWSRIFWEPLHFASPLRGMELWKPLIAAVNGYAFGGGCELALACDIRLASERAQFGLTEVTRGIIPGGGGTQRLPRSVPLGRALEMLFTGERIDAQEAYRIGLVNKVVPPEQLLAEAQTLADRICEAAPLAVRASKEAAYRGLATTLDQGLRIEQFLARIVRTSEDSREGPRAFAEKRKPNFRAT